MAAQAGIEYATNGRGKFANDFNGAKTTLRSQSRRFGNLGSTVHHWAVNERVMLRHAFGFTLANGSSQW